ncbi:MAG: HAD family hydrolase [Chloroflexota bacterium]
MKNLGQLIFDLDGTLLDTMELHARVFSHILERFGADGEFSRRYYLETAGESLAKQFRDVLQRYGLQDVGIKGLIEGFDQRVMEVLERKKQNILFADVEATLPIFQEAGYRLMVSSSGTSMLVKAKLKYSKLWGYFSIVLGSDDDNGLSKGETHFQEMIEQLDMPVEEFNETSVMIGDGLHDMRVGKEQGLVTIRRLGWADQDETIDDFTDFVIHNFNELLGLLKDDEGSFKPVRWLRRKRDLREE